MPFSGDRRLFSFRPNQFTYSPPRALVQSGDLHLTYTGAHQTSDEIKRQYQADVASIDQWLGWMRSEVEPFNTSLEMTVRGLIDQRRQKVLADRNLVVNLGLPIKLRPGEAKTYAVPNVRRKARVETAKPVAGRAPFTPEPALDQQTFEEILRIVRGMGHVMERSPTAFETMGEEDLRQHFLVQLNGQFEGDATGETFNFDGKTDILIRRDDRNVFIAECKFWSGPKTITETIDQILGYLERYQGGDPGVCSQQEFLRSA